MKGIVAAAALVGVAHAASEDFESAFDELKGCHIAFGVCLSDYTGYVGLDESTCNVNLVRDSPFVEDDQTQKVEWYQAYANADALEADARATSSNTFLTRLAPGATVASFKAGVRAAGGSTADFLFCDDSTWSIASGNLGAVSEAAFSFPLTNRLRISPIEFDFGGASTVQTSNKHVVRLMPTAAARGVDFVAELQERANSIDGVEARITRPNIGADRDGVETLLLETSQSSAAVEWIASEADVIWVERAPSHVVNNNEAAALTQSGTELFARQTRAGTTPFWDKGILGQNQIVGVGDSGLDVQSCFFNDPNVNELADKQARRTLGNNVNYNPRTGQATIDPTVESRTDYPTHRKVIQYIAFADGVEGADQGHGTHVAGSVAGSPVNAQVRTQLGNPSGPSFPATDYQGMAPEAKIAFFDIGKFDVPRAVFPPEDYSQMFGPAYEVGARIHTNSWGSAVQFYNAEMVSGDAYVFENQDFLPLFAAGNSGDSGTFTVGTPSIAKNLICVGATNNAEKTWDFIRQNYGVGSTFTCDIKKAGGNCGDSMASFSSNGPTWDGRIKPDVSAPGFYIFSARSNAPDADTCDVFPNAGTSMATPVAAGNAALVRQFFTDGYYPTGNAVSQNAFTPMGALIKAVLVNGADLMPGLNWLSQDLSTTAPDVFQGFGRINLANTLKLDGNTGLSQTIIDGDFDNMSQFKETGESKTYTVDVPANGGGLLRATLVWFEPAASVAAALVRVNDLDITVTGPDGRTVFANGGSTFDRVNQVEQVQVVNPVPGTYTVTVSAHAIRMNDVTQPFAVVISTNLESSVSRAPDSESGSVAVPTTTVAAVAGGVVLLAAGLFVGRSFLRNKKTEQVAHPGNVVGNPMYAEDA